MTSANPFARTSLFYKSFPETLPTTSQMAGKLIVSLSLYLLLATATAALIFFPAARSRLTTGLARLVTAFGNHWRGIRLRANAAVDDGILRSRESRRIAMGGLRRHGWALGVAGLMLLIPVTAALVLRQSNRLAGFDDRARERDPIVGSLLDGEALVPPPPLPPEVFTTREVEQLRPDLGGASRNWDLLDADFRQRLLNVYRQMAAQGYTMALLEGYRSPQRQAQLASESQTVTNAGAYQSYHQYGLAADSAFFRDGKLVISEKDPWAMRGYTLYGQAAEAQGLRWGGRWDLQDYGHVELKRAGVLGNR